VNLYSASSQKNASNALNVLSNDQKETFSVYEENSQFACPAHASCFGTSSMSLVWRQRRCDGRTYRAETVEQRVDGSWRNEDAVVQQLERPVCTLHSSDMLRFRDDSISFCPVSVSIKLLRPYFNQEFYIILYVYVIICCFRASQVFVYLTGMSECRPVHRRMLHNKNSNVRIKQYSNGISLECDE